MRVTILSLTAACAIFISACSTLPIQTSQQLQENKRWLEHKNKLSDISQWKISGRFSAQSESDSWQGSLDWTQKNDHYKIHVSGPLNSGSFSLFGDLEQSTLQITKDKFYTEQDPDSLMENHIGLRLPIKYLRHWILGLPSPLNDKIQIALNENGQISRLSQQGWDITFKRYKKINHVFLPNKIFLENSEFDVRLVIRKWRINDNS